MSTKGHSVNVPNSDEHLRQSATVPISDPLLARTFDDVAPPSHLAAPAVSTRPQHRANHLLTAASLIAATTFGAVALTRQTDQSPNQLAVDAPSAGPPTTLSAAGIASTTTSSPLSSSATIPPETSIASSALPASLPAPKGAPPNEQCTDARHAEVVDYLKSRVKTFSVGTMPADCSIEVWSQGLQPAILTWLSSLPYEVRVIDQAIVPA
jgi:hypothetical protein